MFAVWRSLFARTEPRAELRPARLGRRRGTSIVRVRSLLMRARRVRGAGARVGPREAERHRLLPEEIENGVQALARLSGGGGGKSVRAGTGRSGRGHTRRRLAWNFASPWSSIFFVRPQPKRETMLTWDVCTVFLHETTQPSAHVDASKRETHKEEGTRTRRRWPSAGCSRART